MFKKQSQNSTKSSQFGKEFERCNEERSLQLADSVRLEGTEVIPLYDQQYG